MLQSTDKITDNQTEVVKKLTIHWLI